jgi:hypothetical protein
MYKCFNEKVGLNTILISQFQTYLFTTFINLNFLKFCSWFIINPIEGSILSKWNLNKIWIYFLVFAWKIASFLPWYFFSNFFCILYHVFIHLLLPILLFPKLRNSPGGFNIWQPYHKYWIKISSLMSLGAITIMCTIASVPFAWFFHVLKS